MDVVLCEEVTCPLCCEVVYLSVRIPHSITLSDGRVVWGYRTVMLCPRCCRDDPHASGLLAFFALHEKISMGTFRQAADLIEEWVRHAKGQAYTDSDLMDDIRRFNAGDEP